MSLTLNNNASNRRSSEYLGQLLNDKKQLQALPNVFLHVEKILDEEINRVRSSLLHWNTSKEALRLPEPLGPIVLLSEKLFVPINEYPDFNFVGRILGPRGMTAKQLELDTGCKIMVRGKGSMRDKVKEEQNRGKANWEHLNDDLHVLITVEDTQSRAEIKLRNAVDEVRKLLVPMAEGEDELKKMQLMELAIMNGTFHDAVPAQTLSRQTITVVNTPQGPRMIATPSLNVPAAALPVLQTTPAVLQPTNAMTASTPIIIAPRFQQLPGGTSSMAAMLNGATPPGLVTTPAAAESVAPAANPVSAGLLYYNDPYIQRMLEYSSLEASAAGAVPKLRRTTLAVREHPYTRGPLT